MPQHYFDSFEALLNAIDAHSKADERLKNESGEYYNLFEVINMTSDEVKVHSAFLLDLLSPKGKHRIGSKFLILLSGKLSFVLKI